MTVKLLGCQNFYGGGPRNNNLVGKRTVVPYGPICSWAVITKYNWPNGGKMASTKGKRKSSQVQKLRIKVPGGSVHRDSGQPITVF